MTVKKALKVIDIMVMHDKLIMNNMKEFIIEWTKSNEPPDIPTRAAIIMKEFCENDLKVLGIIKDQLQTSKKKIRCIHPEKFQDIDPKGKRYCTKCNQDL